MAGVGTGGTVMGFGRLFRDRGLSAAVHPASSRLSRRPCRPATRVGHHRI
ncbi:hypothetical protein ACRAWD_31590 [Caulobacter segnis]